MKLSEFMKKYDISQSEMKLHTCKSKTYKDSEDKILFFFIPEAKTFAQGEAQRVFVLSHTAAQAYLDKEVKPGDLEVNFQADYGYGITMPLEGEEIEW
jgi:hypothetical protein